MRRSPHEHRNHTLLDHAWHAYDIDPDDPQAQSLLAWIEQFEDAADTLAPNVKATAYGLLEALSAVIGDPVSEIAASMPSVAAWLGIGQ